jgi:hypothetical protein
MAQVETKNQARRKGKESKQSNGRHEQIRKRKLHQG